MGKTKITKVDVEKEGYIPFTLGDDMPTIYAKQGADNLMTLADETGKVLATNVNACYYNEGGRFVAKTINTVNGKQSKVVIVDKNKNLTNNIS